jgi:hypothetical protein
VFNIDLTWVAYCGYAHSCATGLPAAKKRRHHSFLHLHMRSCRLAGELETVEESIRQPCSVGLAEAQAVTNPWPLESKILQEFLHVPTWWTSAFKL